MNLSDQDRVQLALSSTPILKSAIYDLSNAKITPDIIKKALSFLIDKQGMNNIVKSNDQIQTGQSLSPEQQRSLKDYWSNNSLNTAIGSVGDIGNIKRVTNLDPVYEVARPENIKAIIAEITAPRKIPNVVPDKIVKTIGSVAKRAKDVYDKDLYDLASRVLTGQFRD